MTAARQILVIDRPDGALTAAMGELDQLGFRVVWVPTLRTALDFVTSCPTLSLIIASAAAVDPGGEEFLVQVNDLRPNLKVIWGVAPNGKWNESRGVAPHSLIPEPFRADALRRAVSSLLSDHFYPASVAETIKSAGLEVLGTLGRFEVAGGAFLVANQTALADFSSIIAFTGSASGHLMLSMSAEHARRLYQSFVPGAGPVPSDQLEDLVGELCNRILGRINAFFARHEISIQQTTPIFIRAAGSAMRYPGRHPSFGVQFTDGCAAMSMEYYLDDFDRSKLEGETRGEALRMGEIRYL